VKFALSSRQRWWLAQLFLHPKLTTTGLDEMKTKNRTRLALRLGTPMNLVGDGKPASLDVVTSDRLDVFELEEAHREFLLLKVAALPDIHPYASHVLGEFFEQLETAKATKAAPEVPEGLEPPSGDERWAATEDELEEAKAKAAERERLQGAAAGN
jgi:hypothetical protein